MAALRPPTQVHRAGDVAIALADTVRRIRGESFPFDVAPFRYEALASPEATGAAIATVYEGFAQGNGPSQSTILAAALDRLGITPDIPERKAAMVAAVLAAVPCTNQFHNGDHSREVLANAIWLSQANAVLAAAGTQGAAPMAPIAVARLLLAATMHDLGHDGTANTVPTAGGDDHYVPFRLEDSAFELMRPVLGRAGIDFAVIGDLQAMLRATDPRARPGVRAVTDHALYGVRLPAEVANEFAHRLRHQGLALATALLCDADVISSAGLTHEYYLRLSSLLSTERGTTITDAEARDFFIGVVGDSFASAAGKRLDANLRSIRAAVFGTQNKPA